eukprot:TRINITY_DN24866_c0_g1_i1.p2 TRINITY_DN24866_c0_g1~~TRINITY_DN24866_c0_g1_i1.p2  ORF type:complete len:254 (+),score=8.35 TRINITY_DN24866_c0_g1_i1:1255-2016(+)
MYTQGALSYGDLNTSGARVIASYRTTHEFTNLCRRLACAWMGLSAGVAFVNVCPGTPQDPYSSNLLRTEFQQLLVGLVECYNSLGVKGNVITLGEAGQQCMSTVQICRQYISQKGDSGLDAVLGQMRTKGGPTGRGDRAPYVVRLCNRLYSIVFKHALRCKKQGEELCMKSIREEVGGAVAVHSSDVKMYSLRVKDVARGRLYVVELWATSGCRGRRSTPLHPSCLHCLKRTTSAACGSWRHSLVRAHPSSLH